MPLTGSAQLFGTVAVAHRFEKHGARTSSKMVCWFGLDLAGRENKQEWFRVGAGVEDDLAGGRASLSLNAISHGCSPNAWLAANRQMAF